MAFTQKWGQAHDRGHFAMLRILLAEADGFMTLDVNEEYNYLSIKIDRTRILSEGKKAIGNMLLRLHVYRCTADVDTGRLWYEELTAVDDYWLKIRSIVLANKTPKPLLLQGNTFLEGEVVTLREYELTVDGVIQSWAERMV
jgi:dipeptidyl-peptidase-3